MIDGMGKKYKVITLEEVNDLMTENRRHKQVQEIIEEVEAIIIEQAKRGRREAIFTRHMDYSLTSEKYSERNMRDVVNEFSRNGFYTELSIEQKEDSNPFTWNHSGEIEYVEPRVVEVIIGW